MGGGGVLTTSIDIFLLFLPRPETRAGWLRLFFQAAPAPKSAHLPAIILIKGPGVLWI